jgi:uncharacterized membrane protein
VLLLTCGALIAVTGVALVYVPAALIVTGVAVAAYALLFDDGDSA